MSKDERRRRGLWGFLVGISTVILVVGGAAAGVAFFLVTNPFTPIGEVGYVYEEPRFFGRGGYLGTHDGPGSYGGSFRRQKVINISVLPEMHAEEFDVRAGDRVAHVVCEITLRADPAGVKRLVEEYGAGEWYRASTRSALLRTLRATLGEGLSGDPNISYQTIETILTSDLEQLLERKRIPVWVDGVFIRRIDWDGARPRSGASNSNGPVERGLEDSGAPDAPGTVSQGSTEKKNTDPATQILPDYVPLPGEIPPVLIDVTHPREFRGLWLATVTNVDWPSREGLTAEKQRVELIAFLDAMAEMNFNALLFQVRPAGDAFYRSEIEPWSRWLTGEPAKDPGYDPLQFAIDEGHKRGIEIHAWFNPYRAMMNKAAEIPEKNMAKAFPDHAITYGNFIWMDPGAKLVQDRIVEVINDVVTRYDIAGVHLDDYFYPYPIPGKKFDDTASYLAYVNASGPMKLGDWRRQNIHTLVYRISKEIHAIKPGIKFGISPFGLYRPGEPEGVKGLDQVEEIFSDPKVWIDRGWIDYLTPQLYWKEESKLPFSKLLDWWAGANSLRRHIYPGTSIGRIDDEGWPITEFETQIKISRVPDIVGRQALGAVYFGAKVFNGSKGPALQDLFKKSIYPDPALPPIMGWLENGPKPPRPRRFKPEGEGLRWDEATTGIERWTLYRREPETNLWKLIKVLPASILTISAEPGTYALCSVDSKMLESVGVVAEISGNPSESDPDIVASDPQAEGENESAEVEKQEGEIEGEKEEGVEKEEKEAVQP